MILRFSQFINESRDDNYQFTTYTVPTDGILVSHNYESDELYVASPFFVSHGTSSNVDYGEKHKIFKIKPGTLIVKLESSEDIQNIDLSNVYVSAKSAKMMNDLSMNRENIKIFNEDSPNVKYSELINWAETTNDEFFMYMANQFATLDYLREVRGLDFKVIEFTHEEELVPHQYMILDTTSLVPVDRDDSEITDDKPDDQGEKASPNRIAIKWEVWIDPTTGKKHIYNAYDEYRPWLKD